jgi:hypothetical protein
MSAGFFSEEALLWAENPEWAEKYEGIDFRPPQSVADAAARGLELRKKHKRGGLSPQEAGKAGIGSGVTRATSLKNRQQLSPETIGRMVSYFARHEVDLRSEAARRNTEPTAGEIAWLLWGGNPGRSWAESVKRQMERAEEKGKADHSEADDTLDYTVCERPTGTRYGIASGKECRKGREVSREEVIGELQKAGLIKNQSQLDRLKNLNDEDLAKVSEVAKQRVRGSGQESSPQPIDRTKILEELKGKGAQVEKASPMIEKLSDEELTRVSSNVAQIIGQERGRNIGEMNWDQVEALNSNRETLLKAYKEPSVLTGSLRKVSDEEADAFYSLLPRKMQENLNNSGALNNTQYLQEDGSHGPATDWRGKQLAKRWLEQDGKDLYTGLPLKLADADLEHIIPHKLGGNRSESLDNFGWIHYASNQRKASNSMEKFLSDKVDKPVSMGKDEYTSKVYKPAVAKAEKSGFLESKSPFYAQTPQQLSDEVIKQFGSKLYYISKEWGVKHGFKQGRASTRYFSDYKLPGINEKFTEFVVRRWAGATPEQKEGMKNVSEVVSRELTAGRPSADVMLRAAEDMRRLGLE